jgi:hypothetical protein
MSTTMLSRFRATVLAILAVLALQFVAGMITNLYVEFPDSLPHGSAWAWAFARTSIIPVHVALGTLLLVLSLIAIELAWWADTRLGFASVLAGFLLIALAYLCGIWFLTYGQSNVSSLLMALGFMGAFVAYGAGLLVTRPDAR